MIRYFLLFGFSQIFSLLTCEIRKVTNCYFLGSDKSSAGILVSILLSSRWLILDYFNKGLDESLGSTDDPLIYTEWR